MKDCLCSSLAIHRYAGQHALLMIQPLQINTGMVSCSGVKNCIDRVPSKLLWGQGLTSPGVAECCPQRPSFLSCSAHEAVQTSSSSATLTFALLILQEVANQPPWRPVLSSRCPCLSTRARRSGSIPVREHTPAGSQAEDCPSLLAHRASGIAHAPNHPTGLKIFNRKVNP